MRQKSSGFAVVAALVGVAVFAVVYIASFGQSGHHAQVSPPTGEAIAQQPASASAFSAEAVRAASDTQEQTAAR
jgi:hypothetical protein